MIDFIMLVPQYYDTIYYKVKMTRKFVAHSKLFLLDNFII